MDAEAREFQSRGGDQEVFISDQGRDWSVAVGRGWVTPDEYGKVRENWQRKRQTTGLIEREETQKSRKEESTRPSQPSEGDVGGAAR